MKIFYCIVVSMFVIVAFAIHSANAKNPVQVQIMSDQEASGVTGALCDDLCKQLSTGCLSRPCDGKHKGEDCYGSCDHSYRNWECKFYLAGTGCNDDDPDRECGWQEAGSCNEDGDCVCTTQNDCGDTSDCHNT